MYGRVIRLGISPKYFLDEMSIDEMVALLKADDNSNKEDWHKVRKQCFWYVKAQGGELSEKQFYKRYFPLPWDKDTKPVKGSDKKQFDKKVKQAEKWLETKKLV